jgi:hypothetical protein
MGIGVAVVSHEEEEEGGGALSLVRLRLLRYSARKDVMERPKLSFSRFPFSFLSRTPNAEEQINEIRK